MKNFLSKINYRLLFIHFIAYWFFVYGFDTLGSIYDYKFLYYSHLMLVSDIAKERFNSDILIINLFGTAGLIVAYIISWQLSVRRNWYWANSVIIFLLVFFLKSHDYLGWASLKTIFLALGNLISDNALMSIFINAAVMLTIGFFLLLKKQILEFIDRSVKPVDKDVARKAARMAAIGKKK